MSTIHKSGPAFPIVANNEVFDLGVSIRDWFATHAPTPPDHEIVTQMQFDKSRNPHNDYHKPKLRSRREIIADLAFEYADAMLAARSKP